MNSAAWRLLVVAGILFVTSVISLGVGAVWIEPVDVIRMLTGTTRTDDLAVQSTIVWQLRLPRMFLACVVGAGLGTAGAGYQGLFRNPLADPFVIGASSGASLGATVALICGWNINALGLAGVPFAAMIGALLAVGAVYSVASVGRDVPILSLLLAGIAVSSLLNAVVSLLMFLHGDRILTIFGWLMGSLSGHGWVTLWTTAPLITAGGIGLWLQSRSLDAMSFGDESAASLGLSIIRLRRLLTLTATLITAASVAAGGIIGFVGLIAPHMARSLVGARHGFVIPMSGLLGALLLLIADDFARTIVAPSELPVGVITALVGSPFFLVLMKNRQRQLGAEGGAGT